jgi:type IV fimbrial biogenesis protein FimT
VKGFTLIELLVTLALAAILLGIGIPSMRDFVANHRVGGAAQELYAALSYARSEAVKRNAEVGVTPAGGQWQDGWSVTSAGNGELYRQQPALEGISAAGAATIRYRGDGRVQAAASVTFCDNPGSTAVKRRIVSVDTSGIPMITQGEGCQ